MRYWGAFVYKERALPMSNLWPRAVKRIGSIVWPSEPFTVLAQYLTVPDFELV